MTIWFGLGALFIFVGLLELAFCGLSLVGTLSGSALTALSLGGAFEHAGDGELAWVGPLLLVFYPLWMVATAVAAAAHAYAGVQLLRGRPTRRLLWTVTVCSLPPILTVYCAPTSMLGAVAGLVGALWIEKGAQAPPG